MISKPPKTLSKAECEQLLEELSKSRETDWSRRSSIRDKTMVLLMLDAGLRVGEVVRLKVSDLIYGSSPVREIRVRPEITKRHTERFVPVTIRLDAAIWAMLEFIWLPDGRPAESCAFYSSKRRKKLSYQQVGRIVKAAAAKSIHRDIHPHMLRHTYATRLMRVANIRVVQKLLGHKRLSSTEIYTHPDQEDIERAVDKMQTAD